MNLKNEDFMIKILSFINKNIQLGKRLSWIDREVKRQIDAKYGRNLREKADLRRAFMNYARCHQAGLGTVSEIKKVMKRVRTLDDRSQTYSKLERLDEQLKTGRIGFPRPTVFYLCSTHVSPAADHKEYQGKVYVDRYWKKTMQDWGSTDKEIYAVASYIRNHNVLTVQEVVTGDPYLIWRNHCKHFFVPLGTDEVLHSSLKDIRGDHKEAVTYSRNKTKLQYRKDRVRLAARLEAIGTVNSI